MSATSEAVYTQHGAASVLAAFPQTSTALDLDLIQIVAQSGATLAKVNYAGTVFGPAASGLVLTSVAVSSFAVTQVVASTGVVDGTFTGGASNAFAGMQVAILGFTNAGNNGTFTVTASSVSSITITPIASLVNETHAATASVYGVSTATYNGTITGGGAGFDGQSLTVTGFTNATNNVVGATISSATGSTVVVPFAGQIAETHAGAASVTVAATKGARVGVFRTNLTIGASLASLFGNAFSNPSKQDILQVRNIGGNISYYLNYQGVATGS